MLDANACRRVFTASSASRLISGLAKAVRDEACAMRETRPRSLAISAKALLLPIDRVVSGLGTLAIAVIHKARKGLLLR